MFVMRPFPHNNNLKPPHTFKMNYIVAHLLFLFLKFCARKIYFFCHFLFNKILILRRIKSAVQGEVTERPPGSLQIKSRTSFSGITNRHRCGGRRSKVTANRETDELNIFCSWNHTSRSVGNLHRRRVPPLSSHLPPTLPLSHPASSWLGPPGRPPSPNQTHHLFIENVTKLLLAQRRGAAARWCVQGSDL